MNYMSGVHEDISLLKDQKHGFNNMDERTAKSLNFIMDKNLKYMTEFVKRCYSDPTLIGNYNAIRSIYSHDDWKNKSGARELYRPPHPIVHRFIDAEMTKKHGKEWKQDKNTFRKVCKTEPLIQPWLVIPPDKI